MHMLFMKRIECVFVLILNCKNKRASNKQQFTKEKTKKTTEM